MSDLNRLEKMLNESYDALEKSSKQLFSARVCGCFIGATLLKVGLYGYTQDFLSSFNIGMAAFVVMFTFLDRDKFFRTTVSSKGSTVVRLTDKDIELLNKYKGINVYIHGTALSIVKEDDQ